MRKFILTAAAVVVAVLSLPAMPAHSEDRVVIKSGDRHHHRHWRDHHKKVVVIKHREHRRHRGAVVVKER